MVLNCWGWGGGMFTRQGEASIPVTLLSDQMNTNWHWMMKTFKVAKHAAAWGAVGIDNKISQERESGGRGRERERRCQREPKRQKALCVYRHLCLCSWCCSDTCMYMYVVNKSSHSIAIWWHISYNRSLHMFNKTLSSSSSSEKQWEALELEHNRNKTTPTSIIQ